ncbi:EDL [Lepeophtheirus salmonis]|uniref:EDL n=1 Tax=Lepeophtheirus salmonis TaxID=72036 RepID=A0A7R8D6D1_LEPSM|nr:EDL [Lepeophtheirus salmonis]CAF3043723.1 EDL [Lepeophtheirus salmonis]
MILFFRSKANDPEKKSKMNSSNTKSVDPRYKFISSKMLSDGNWPNSSLVHTPWFARPVMGGVEDVTSTSTTSHRTRSSSVRSTGGGGRLSPRIVITSNCPQGRGEDIGHSLYYPWILVIGIEKMFVSGFLMNGKALCLMSVAMFTYRVPLGGKLLYKDFQLRLSKAMYNEETSSSSSAATTNSSSLQLSSSHVHHHRGGHHHHHHNHHHHHSRSPAAQQSTLYNNSVAQYDQHRTLIQSHDYIPGSKVLR